MDEQSLDQATRKSVRESATSLCKHTAGEGGVQKASYCGTVAAAGADAERLTCLTIATVGAGARFTPTVLSSHCCSRAAVLGLDE